MPEDKQEPEFCDHPVNFGGLCGVCGMDLTQYDEFGVRKDARVSIQMSHENNMLFVSKEEAARIENETSKRLLKTRKLSLILDLDQTVIHATVDPSIDHFLLHPAWKSHSSLQDIHMFQLPGSPETYHVKLRPGFQPFLQAINQMFELHIYTMGTRNYATAVSRIIDPHQQIFRERILSRDESGSFTQKTIQRLFPCDDSMVVVVDDRADVWDWSGNLIKVRPYHFFVNTGDLNDPAKLEKLSVSKDRDDTNQIAAVEELLSNDTETTTSTTPSMQKLLETELPPPAPLESPLTEEFPRINEIGNISPPFIIEDNDKELETVSKILKDLHADFYERMAGKAGKLDINERAKAGIDVKTILTERRHNVLGGCKFVFSGVIVVGSDPKKSEIWKFAEAFGAECHHQLNDETTHVIAAKWGTEKTRQAEKIQTSTNPNLWIVGPNWLLDSAHSWTRQPEYKYALDKTTNEDDSQQNELFRLLDNPSSSRPNSSLSIHLEDDSFLNEEDIEGIELEIENELADDFTDDDESLKTADEGALTQETSEAVPLKRTKRGRSPSNTPRKKLDTKDSRKSFIRTAPRKASPLRNNISFPQSENDLDDGDESLKPRMKRAREILEENESISESEVASDFDIDAMLADFNDDDWDEEEEEE